MSDARKRERHPPRKLERAGPNRKAAFVDRCNAALPDDFVATDCLQTGAQLIDVIITHVAFISAVTHIISTDPRRGPTGADARQKLDADRKELSQTGGCYHAQYFDPGNCAHAVQIGAIMRKVGLARPSADEAAAFLADPQQLRKRRRTEMSLAQELCPRGATRYCPTLCNAATQSCKRHRGAHARILRSDSSNPVPATGLRALTCGAPTSVLCTFSSSWYSENHIRSPSLCTTGRMWETCLKQSWASAPPSGTR